MTPTSVLDRPARRSAPKPPDERINRTSSIPFLALHLMPLLAIFTGVSRTDLILCAALYLGRMFFITAGYHRYFAHRSYKMARVPQFLMALGGSTAAQKGPLWWAAHHRDHHRYADTDRDIHSPSKGFWWSHVGWFLSNRFKATNVDGIRDFARYPELRWLDRHDWVGPWALGIATFLAFGWSGLVVGFFTSTIFLWHGTFLVNSVAHVFGRRRYETDDTSRNSLLIALVTAGEGWHNNHHRYQSAARQGFRWWQIDTSYYMLWLLSRVGIVHDLRPVPRRVIDEARQRR